LVTLAVIPGDSVAGADFAGLALVAHMERTVRVADLPSTKVSVVVPVLDEVSNLELVGGIISTGQRFESVKSHQTQAFGL